MAKKCGFAGSLVARRSNQARTFAARVPYSTYLWVRPNWDRASGPNSTTAKEAPAKTRSTRRKMAAWCRGSSSKYASDLMYATSERSPGEGGSTGASLDLERLSAWGKVGAIDCSITTTTSKSLDFVALWVEVLGATGRFGAANAATLWKSAGYKSVSFPPLSRTIGVYFAGKA